MLKNENNVPKTKPTIARIFPLNKGFLSIFIKEIIPNIIAAKGTKGIKKSNEHTNEATAVFEYLCLTIIYPTLNTPK
mgnify:CR=1 FL=1